MPRRDHEIFPVLGRADESHHELIAFNTVQIACSNCIFVRSSLQFGTSTESSLMLLLVSWQKFGLCIGHC